MFCSRVSRCIDLDPPRLIPLVEKSIQTISDPEVTGIDPILPFPCNSKNSTVLVEEGGERLGKLLWSVWGMNLVWTSGGPRPPSILNKITPTCRLKSKLRIASHTLIWRCDRSEVLQVAALPPYKQRTRPEPWDQQEIVVHCNVSWWFKINSESTEKMYDDWCI